MLGFPKSWLDFGAGSSSDRAAGGATAVADPVAEEEAEIAIGMDITRELERLLKELESYDRNTQSLDDLRALNRRYKALLDARKRAEAS